MTADQQRDLEELRAWLERRSQPVAFGTLSSLKTRGSEDAKRWLAALDALRAETQEPSSRGN